MSNVSNRELSDLGLLPPEGASPETPDQIVRRKVHGTVRQILANELGITVNSIGRITEEVIRKRIDEAIGEYLTPDRMEAALAKHIRAGAADAWSKKFSSADMQRAVAAEIEAEFRRKAQDFIRDNIRIRADVRPEPVRKLVI